jgi:hypothetical protein
MIGMAAVTTVGTTVGIVGGVGWAATQLKKFFSWAKWLVTDEKGKFSTSSTKAKIAETVAKARGGKTDFVPEKEVVLAFKEAKQHKHFVPYVSAVSDSALGNLMQVVTTEMEARVAAKTAQKATRNEKVVNP